MKKTYNEYEIAVEGILDKPKNAFKSAKNTFNRLVKDDSASDIPDSRSIADAGKVPLDAARRGLDKAYSKTKNRAIHTTNNARDFASKAIETGKYILPQNRDEGIEAINKGIKYAGKFLPTLGLSDVGFINNKYHPKKEYYLNPNKASKKSGYIKGEYEELASEFETYVKTSILPILQNITAPNDIVEKTLDFNRVIPYQDSGISIAVYKIKNERKKEINPDIIKIGANFGKTLDEISAGDFYEILSSCKAPPIDAEAIDHYFYKNVIESMQRMKEYYTHASTFRGYDIDDDLEIFEKRKCLDMLKDLAKRKGYYKNDAREIFCESVLNFIIGGAERSYATKTGFTLAELMKGTFYTGAKRKRAETIGGKSIHRLPPRGMEYFHQHIMVPFFVKTKHLVYCTPEQYEKIAKGSFLKRNIVGGLENMMKTDRHETKV